MCGLCSQTVAWDRCMSLERLERDPEPAFATTEALHLKLLAFSTLEKQILQQDLLQYPSPYKFTLLQSSHCQK
ncbi:mCG1028619 [Mus musculus]|nr:mCG1028619 [Mus musculus]